MGRVTWGLLQGCPLREVQNVPPIGNHLYVRSVDRMIIRSGCRTVSTSQICSTDVDIMSLLNVRDLQVIDEETEKCWTRLAFSVRSHTNRY